MSVLFVLQCESLTCNCGFSRGGSNHGEVILACGARAAQRLARASDFLSLKTVTPTVDLTTAPQDECLTRCARRPRPGYAAPPQIFSAVRTVQQRSRAADIIFKEEALTVMWCQTERSGPTAEPEPL